MNAASARRRGRPPRIRPDIAIQAVEQLQTSKLNDILADQVHAPPLSEYSENLAAQLRAAPNLSEAVAQIQGTAGTFAPDATDEQIAAFRAATNYGAEQTRPSMRPEMREEDPRARAARRAAELRDMGGLDDGTDEFHIASDEIPQDWSYEWKRFTVVNQEDPSYWGQVLRHGWEPVPASRHPHMVAGGGNQKVIERKGMVLCERPAEITREMRLKADREARLQVQAKEAEATGKPIGPFDRDNPRLGQKISRTYEAPVAIPD